MTTKTKTQSTGKKPRLSDRTNKLSPSGIRKFFDLLSSMEGVISLGVGEPDFTTPWSIRESAIESIESGQTMYTSNSGTPELRREIARSLAFDYHADYEPMNEILVTVGVSEALDLAMRAIINPGDEVIVPDPSFVAYTSAIILAEGVPVSIPTYEEKSFEISAADIEKRVTPRTRAILLGYPSNPTGAVLSRQKMMDIAQLARKHNLIIISDEIYAKLTYGVEHTCIASLPGMKDNTILLGGFSKAYAMTGWRIGYACASKEIIGGMTKIHQYTMMCASTMGQVAALEALKGDQNCVKEMVEDYNRRRKIIVKGFNEIGLRCFEPKGAFYAFPNISVTGLTSEEFAEKLLEEEKVAVVSGAAFGKCGEGYVRCCYATGLDDIQEALLRMKRFVNKYRK
ncbi:MAG TPA: aminotransferase class I/II-fold pyridoxal phosphate-dependent enzyme [Dehalococcoidales bacterium]|nr:aminotransferase class I/II-fold pyridoxal phosphate-dependent enzyme [Dehalococcoidales bacterium]